MKWCFLGCHQENATFSLVTHLFSHFPCRKMCVICGKTPSAAFIDICLEHFWAIGAINKKGAVSIDPWFYQLHLLIKLGCGLARISSFSPEGVCGGVLITIACLPHNCN